MEQIRLIKRILGFNYDLLAVIIFIIFVFLRYFAVFLNFLYGGKYDSLNFKGLAERYDFNCVLTGAQHKFIG